MTLNPDEFESIDEQLTPQQMMEYENDIIQMQTERELLHFRKVLESLDSEKLSEELLQDLLGYAREQLPDIIRKLA